MIAFENRIFRRVCNVGPRFFCPFIILALAAFECSAVAQPNPAFYRTDYLLHSAIGQTSGLVVSDVNKDGKLDVVVGAGEGINVSTLLELVYP
jgi:FG-GAP repeat